MKLLDMVSVLFLLSATLGADATAADINPITRVVQLLEGLAEKIEQDGKVEEDLFDKYVCWATTVIKTKTASNAAAKDRIEALEAYIADIEAGKVEFTSERTDLEKLVESLNKEIETSEDKRKKEKKDFEAAEDEMKKAIAALEEAISVLDEATKDHKGSLISVKREVQTFQQGEHSGVHLSKAIHLGEKYLAKSDAYFLKRLLSGDAVQRSRGFPTKAGGDFKMKYKARSGKIQKILADMLQTFEANLKDAQEKEKDAADSYKKLMDSKKDELESAETALTEGNAEGTAKGMAKEEAKQEVKDLKDQVDKDEGYIKDTEDALKDMKKQWEERCKLRTLEIKSINEAIAILNSDEARDTMRASMKSQGYLLLQKSTTRAIQQEASNVLRQAGVLAKDTRLNQLAIKVLMQQEGHFDKVLKAIDKMIDNLKDDEEEDLKNKEDCEDDRMENTKDARVKSLEVDDATDEITREKAKIAEAEEQVKLLKEKIKTMEEDLKVAKRQREDEKAEFESSLAQDKAAVELITKAMDVLKAFREDNELDLVQANAKQKRRQPGEAPPPPPATFDEPYGGAKGESNGIQAILGMIKDDIKKDIDKSKDEEKAAKEAYKKMKEDTEAEIESCESSIADYKDKIAEAEKAVGEAEESKTDSKKALDSIMESIKDAEPDCNFITVNFEMRIKNRQIEIDGLLKAKTILSAHGK